MAGTKDYAVLDLQNETDSLGVDLQFQDFGDARTQSSSHGAHHEQTITFSDFPDTAEEELEQEKLLGGEDEDDKPIGLKSGSGFWTFDFYQQFFDVESKQVGDRILWSMVPKPGVSYLQSYIRPNPDLYGPFWICMTLTFTTAITGNLANYLGTRPEESYVWKYDFHKVTLAATAIFSYAWLVPMAMWGILVWRGSRAKISLLELLCIYGYSLAIFVPVSILWIVPQPWFKWCLAIVAPVLSGSVLVRTVWPSLSHDAKQIAIGIAAFILILHATLALGFMLYFFTAPDKAPSTIIPVPPVSPDNIKNDTNQAPVDESVAKNIENNSNPGPQKDPGGGSAGGGTGDGKNVPEKIDVPVVSALHMEKKPTIEKKSIKKELSKNSNSKLSNSSNTQVSTPSIAKANAATTKTQDASAPAVSQTEPKASSMKDKVEKIPKS